MNRKFCDWCNADVTDIKKHSFAGDSTSFLANDQQASAHDVNVDLDLCSDCFGELGGFFQSKIKKTIKVENSLPWPHNCTMRIQKWENEWVIIDFDGQDIMNIKYCPICGMELK